MKYTFLPLALCIAIVTTSHTYGMEEVTMGLDIVLDICGPRLSLLPSLTELAKELSQGNSNAINQFIERSYDQQSAKNDVLFLASYMNDTQVASTALQYGADINARKHLEETPLMIATRCGYKKMIQYLLNNEATIDLKDQYGHTALFFAAAEGHASTVSLLLDRTLNLNVEDCKRALCAAAINGHLSVISLLISKTALRRLKDICTGDTLHNVDVKERCTKELKYTIIKRLLQLSLDPAVQCYLANPVQYVVTKCQPHNESSLYIGQVPLLMIACMFGHTNVVEILKSYSISSGYLSWHEGYYSYMLRTSLDALNYAFACGNDDTAAACIEAFGEHISWLSWKGELDRLLQGAQQRKNQKLISALLHKQHRAAS